MNNSASKNSFGKSVAKMLGITMVGGIIGFGGGMGRYFASETMGEPLTLDVFFRHFDVVLYGVLAVQLLLGLYFFRMRQLVKKEGYSDEEGSVYACKERQIGLLQGVGTTLSVVTMPLFLAMMYYCGIETLLPVGAFCAIVFVNFCNEVGLVRLCGKVNPKLDVDWSKLTMNQDLYQRMDEREREQMGQIGAKLVNSIHFVFVIAMMVVMLLSAVLDFSGYELVLLSALWGIVMMMITLEKHKLG